MPNRVAVGLLGGPVPKRQVRAEAIRPNLTETFVEFQKGTDGRKASTALRADLTRWRSRSGWPRPTCARNWTAPVAS